jgi:hypothetical protein
MREAEQLAIDGSAAQAYAAFLPSLEEALLRAQETASAPEGHPIHEVRVADPEMNRAMRRARARGRGYQR